MIETVKLYSKLIGVSMRSQLQHRASFIMLASGHFVSTLLEAFGIWVLFERFKFIEGWTLEELALIYGILHMGFATAECSARSFDTFSELIKSGDFDRVLLRPCSTLFQIATREFQLLRIGRFLQGLAVLLWACSTLHLSFFSVQGLIIALSYIGTACLFYGLFVIQATISFWTVETLELMNITTYGGVEAGQFPMSIYKPGFKVFFTFIIPLACVAYYPIASMLHHEKLPLIAAAVIPLAGALFLYFSCLLWKIGVKHYHSTGS